MTKRSFQSHLPHRSSQFFVVPLLLHTSALPVFFLFTSTMSDATPSIHQHSSSTRIQSNTQQHNHLPLKHQRTNSGSYTVVTLYDVQKPEFNEISEDTILIGMILNIHKSELNQRIPIFNTSFKGSTKTPTPFVQEKYDRYISIADLSNPDGTCFCLLLQTNKQTRELFSHIQDKVAIGDIIQVIEPKATNRSLSTITNDLPIFTTTSPLEFYKHTIQLPTYPYIIPDNPITKFFLLHGVKINVVRATMENSICGGRMCDRAALPTTTKTCGCMFESTPCKLVLQMDLYCTCDDCAETIFVENYRSWKTTELFIENLTRSTVKDFYSQRDRQRRMREVIKHTVQHINNHGGWQIAGWFRVGSLQDAAEKGVKPATTTTSITAQSVTPHIVSLTPESNAVSLYLKTNKYSLPTLDLTHRV